MSSINASPDNKILDLFSCRQQNNITPKVKICFGKCIENIVRKREKLMLVTSILSSFPTKFSNALLSQSCSKI